jgi:hypothetical protein
MRLWALHLTWCSHQTQTGEGMTEEVESIGIIGLIRRMLSPKTLPHLVLAALLSATLMGVSSINEGLSAILFASVAIAYLILALLSNVEVVQNLTRLPDSASEGGLFTRMGKSFRICILPLLLAGVISGIVWSLFAGDEWVIVDTLAALFIAWSIVQARSFRTGMVEWFANGLGDARLHTYRGGLSTTSQFFIVQGFAFIIIWAVQALSAGESLSWGSALLGGFLFLVSTIIAQFFILWWTREEREMAGAEKGLAAFSFKWMLVAQLFIVWHLFSIYRRTVMNASPASTFIEEGLLMAFTVLFAIWGLTTHTVQDGKALVSQEAALPLGVAFGYAYAGSVTMLTGTFENIETVMVVGHVLTVITIFLILNPTLRASRTTSELKMTAETVVIENTEVENEVEETEEEVSESKEKVWQEDNEVDWAEGNELGNDAEWSEDDLELVEKSEESA